MFGLLTRPVTAALDVTADTFAMMIGEGDGPTAENVAELIDAGLTIAAIAHGFDVAEDVIERLVEE